MRRMNIYIYILNRNPVGICLHIHLDSILYVHAHHIPTYCRAWQSTHIIPVSRQHYTKPAGTRLHNHARFLYKISILMMLPAYVYDALSVYVRTFIYVYLKLYTHGLYHSIYHQHIYIMHAYVCTMSSSSCCTATAGDL